MNKPTIIGLRWKMCDALDELEAHLPMEHELLDGIAGVLEAPAEPDILEARRLLEGWERDRNRLAKAIATLREVEDALGDRLYNAFDPKAGAIPDRLRRVRAAVQALHGPGPGARTSFEEDRMFRSLEILECIVENTL